MSRKATQKQYAFALEYLETGKPSDSYRAAGYACDKMSAGHIAEEAQRLLKVPHVARIIQEGRAEARERSQVTIESLTDELEAARKVPRVVDFSEDGRHEAAVYERDRLPVGAMLEGPLIVEEATSTTLVHPGQHLRVDEFGFLHITNV